jgi:hypothetical protein
MRKTIKFPLLSDEKLEPWGFATPGLFFSVCSLWSWRYLSTTSLWISLLTSVPS